MTLRLTVPVAFVLAAFACPALAQQSAGFKLSEHVFNAGGHPRDGAILVSPRFHASLGAIGEAVSATALASPSFRMDAGFVTPYPAPGEVRNVTFRTDRATLDWDAERAAGAYNVYRDPVTALPGTFGSCLFPRVPEPHATDPDVPVAGSGWFYLVTAENGLGEEGSKGTQHSGAPRGNPAPCP